MPYITRIYAPGALQYIVIRGAECKAIFKEDTDREDFIERLSSLRQGEIWRLMYASRQPRDVVTSAPVAD